jgi:putative endonuclease
VTGIAHPTPAQAAGGDAEDRAATLLARHGLAIVERNYRTRLGEIDLVAREGECLVFVEVRSRAGDAYGGALESITPQKRRRIVAAARQYINRYARVPPCRFDVILLEGGEPRWIRAAFDVA